MDEDIKDLLQGYKINVLYNCLLNYPYSHIIWLAR